MNKSYGVLLVVWISIMVSTIPAFAHTADAPFVTELIAGKHMDAGDVSVWNDADYLYVKYTTIPDWCLTKTHLHVATGIDGIPQTQNGNPVPGKFDYKATHDCISDTTYQIALTWAEDTQLCIAAKAEAQGTLGGAVKASAILTEGAWADGLEFPGKSWATYFTYTVQEPIAIGWANLQWPPSMAGFSGEPTDPAYGQVWIDGVTSEPGPAPGLRAQLGFGPEDSNPDGNPDWTWVEAAFNVDAGNNDEFMASMVPMAAGMYDYVYRYSLSDGADWLYADLNGPIPEGSLPANPGELTVTDAPRMVDVTFNVTVPGQTPPEGLVYIAGTLDRFEGDLPQWDPGGVLLTEVGDFLWTITLRGPEGASIEYKYTLGSWSFVEWDPSCEEIPNRGFVIDWGSDGTQTIDNTVATWRNIDPCGSLVMLTINLTAPESTPVDAIVYIAGSLSMFDGGLPDWDPAGVPLEYVGGNDWRITFTGPDSGLLSYKFTLGSWDSVEKGAGCEEIGNREVFVDYGLQTVSDSVFNWQNLGPCGGPGPVDATFNVTVPENTPADATVYIAGTLSMFDGGLPDWDPGAVALSKVGDYEWEITFTGPDSGLLSYKFTLGSWDLVEKGASCEEISNREVFVSGTQTVNDAVLNWRNIDPCGP